jgi:two-component system CheB/CheR fusion protein
MSETSAPDAKGDEPDGAVPQAPKGGPGVVRVPRGGANAPDFPIVAIGASAGGLDAVAGLLDALPDDTGMAFLLVQHLDPDHESQMAELLTRHTGMRIRQAEEGMAIAPDELVICPPGQFLAVRYGVLHLSRPREPRHARLPIDFLIRSLAHECGPRSVAVILSGTGSDGSGALVALKQSGGHIIVQDPEEAEYDGMPRSAVLAGLADAVVPLADMPRELSCIATEIAAATAPSLMQPREHDEADIQAIIAMLRERVGQDFSAYKRGTLERRIHRRMGLRGLPSGALDRYREELGSDQEECAQLAQDLLINVTSFFRDPTVFELLEREIVPELIGSVAANQTLRIWVVGCSTGEEAYSLAMIFRDAIMASRRDIKLQIFASDIDAQAIAVAREGFYQLTIADEIPADRLARYFVAEDNGYRVTSSLRGSVVFTVQDVLHDPPFSRMDMVSCRNLLIYIKPEAQAKVISLFHFALREGGILMLGMAETPSQAANRFAVLHEGERIYRHVTLSKPGEVAFPLSFVEHLPRLDTREAKQQISRQAALANLCSETVVELFAPASLLVNAQRQCLYSVGPVSRYLKVASGPPTLDLLELVPLSLRSTLRFAIARADRERPLVRTQPCQVTIDRQAVFVTMTVQFIEKDGEELHLVSFVEEAASGAVNPAPSPDEAHDHILKLERELEVAHEELLKAMQSRDALVLEQKAINDEALSVNEEFQSTNEELLTSKEELLSLNEELIALNSQLQETLDRQRVASDDLQNILNSSNVATLFLDSDLCIRFFTPATRLIFNVIPSDIGRPLSDLQPLTEDDLLLADARLVLRDSNTIEREISGPGESWFQRRIFPYRTHDDRVEGVVITFIEITERRRAGIALEEARRAADRSNRGKSRFLAVASHDLRQPLQSLKLIQETLLYSLDDGTARDLTVRFGLLLDSMAGMLNSLLDINQIESGVLQIEKSAFPAADLLARLKTEFLPLAENASITLRLVPTGAILFGDPRLLEVMLRNLLSNAIKYTQPHGHILMGCRNCGETVRIEVWDTGIGIAADELEPIFDEFHQLDNPARERERGFGLGLTIVRELSQVLGHPIEVRSWPGRGSVFSVNVARGAASQVAREPASTALAIQQLDGADTRVIALVEDDPGVRNALEFLLAAGGYRVISAKDGPSALALLASEPTPPDLILTDYNLPGGMSGIDVLAAVRSRLGLDMPGIVLTGDIAKDTLAKIQQVNCIMLSKPAAAADLNAAITTLLSSADPD